MSRLTKEQIDNLSISVEYLISELQQLNPNDRITIATSIYYGNGDDYYRPFKPIRDNSYPNLYIIADIDGMP